VKEQIHVSPISDIAPIARTAEVLLVRFTIFVRAVAALFVVTVGEQTLERFDVVVILWMNRQI